LWCCCGVVRQAPSGSVLCRSLWVPAGAAGGHGGLHPLPGGRRAPAPEAGHERL
jgi:hypothetical protein